MVVFFSEAIAFFKATEKTSSWGASSISSSYSSPNNSRLRKSSSKAACGGRPAERSAAKKRKKSSPIITNKRKNKLCPKAALVKNPFQPPPLGIWGTKVALGRLAEEVALPATGSGTAEEDGVIEEAATLGVRAEDVSPATELTEELEETEEALLEDAALEEALVEEELAALEVALFEEELAVLFVVLLLAEEALAEAVEAVNNLSAAAGSFPCAV